MELQGLAQSTTATFRAHIQLVRLFMRDFGELNLLIKGEESSDRMIAWATLDFLSDFNGTPQFTAFTLEDMYSMQLQSLATRGTCIALLQSVMLLYMRNTLPFNDGGISVDFNNKTGLIQSVLNLFQSAYEQNKRQVKIAINVGALLDLDPSGVLSEYSTLTLLGYTA